MKVGGNSRAKEFFDSQSDIYPGISLSEKYNSRAAALYRDKVRFYGDARWTQKVPSLACLGIHIGIALPINSMVRQQVVCS